MKHPPLIGLALHEDEDELLGLLEHIIRHLVLGDGDWEPLQVGVDERGLVVVERACLNSYEDQSVHDRPLVLFVKLWDPVL